MGYEIEKIKPNLFSLFCASSPHGARARAKMASTSGSSDGLETVGGTVSHLLVVVVDLCNAYTSSTVSEDPTQRVSARSIH